MKPDAVLSLIEKAEGLCSNSIMLVIKLQADRDRGKWLKDAHIDGGLWLGDACIAKSDGRTVAEHLLDINEPRHREGYAAWAEIKTLLRQGASALSPGASPGPKNRILWNDAERTEIDEFVVMNPQSVHVEQMGDSNWWMCVTLPDGRDFHVNFFAVSKKRMTLKQQSCELDWDEDKTHEDWKDDTLADSNPATPRTTEASASTGGVDQGRNERFPSGSSTVAAPKDGPEEGTMGVDSSGPSVATDRPNGTCPACERDIETHWPHEARLCLWRLVKPPEDEPEGVYVGYGIGGGSAHGEDGKFTGPTPNEQAKVVGELAARYEQHVRNLVRAGATEGSARQTAKKLIAEESRLLPHEHDWIPECVGGPMRCTRCGASDGDATHGACPTCGKSE